MDNMYDDIIYLPHFEPYHKRMTISNRSAQFAPFAALTGYSDCIDEVSRFTEEEKVISDDYKDIFDSILIKASKDINNKPEVSINYFVADRYKSGGKCIKYTGRLTKIDYYNSKLVFMDKNEIHFKDIKQINYNK